MTDDANRLSVLPDKVRTIESKLSHLDDRLGVLEQRRTTWVPWHSWENLSGRQREVAYFLFVWVALLVARRIGAPRTPAG